MSVRYVGRTTYFNGKRLFDILSKLKDFGVGRMVYRKRFCDRYPEPSYYVITKVEPDMSDVTQSSGVYSKSYAFGHKVFRGEDFSECKIDASYKSDWRLVPKHEEEMFKAYDGAPRQKNFLPTKFSYPPLMDYMTRLKLKNEGQPSDGPLEIPFYFRENKFSRGGVKKTLEYSDNQ